MESPLTAVDFTPDGTGLVLGSTQGKIYQYDLRNTNVPTRVTVAHKTSVTCLRFQSNNVSKHKVAAAPPPAAVCHLRDINSTLRLWEMYLILWPIKYDSDSSYSFGFIPLTWPMKMCREGTFYSLEMFQRPLVDKWCNTPSHILS